MLDLKHELLRKQQELGGEKSHCLNFTNELLAYFCDKKSKIKGVLEVCTGMELVDRHFPIFTFIIGWKVVYM